MITVEKIDGKIVVKFPYNKDYIEKIKSIDPFISRSRIYSYNS